MKIGEEGMSDGWTKVVSDLELLGRPKKGHTSYALWGKRQGSFLPLSSTHYQHIRNLDIA